MQISRGHLERLELVTKKCSTARRNDALQRVRTTFESEDERLARVDIDCGGISRLDHYRLHAIWKVFDVAQDSWVGVQKVVSSLPSMAPLRSACQGDG